MKFKFIQKFDDDWRELFTKQVREDESFGAELWSALGNVYWFHHDDPDKTKCGYVSFRGAGAFIASMLCYGDYMDWYCSGPAGVVSERIASAMASRGWYYDAD